MKGLIGLTGNERDDILKQHRELYNGYATKNVSTNMYPLTVHDHATDKGGITLNNDGNVKTYTNVNINEITAKALNYDEIDQAYEFDSKGPGDENLGYNVYSDVKPAYDFDSIGPSDVFEEEGFVELDDINLKDEVEEDKLDGVTESVNKTLEMFKKFKKYN